jgi:hypothetical protein
MLKKYVQDIYLEASEGQQHSNQLCFPWGSRLNNAAYLVT